MSRRAEWTAIVLLFLLAAVLRFWVLDRVPPGLCHDEVTNRLIARDILSGNHAVYSTAGYGRETFYHYVMAVTIAIFGDHWLGVRYPSAALGLLGLAITYVLVRRLFGVLTALLTGGWLALSFWPLFYARVGLRSISLPFIAALSAYSLLRAIKLSPLQSHNSPVRPCTYSGLANWLLAGIFLGLSLYTYTSARILPVLLVAFLIYLFLTRSLSPVPWSRLLMFFFTAAVVSVPLVSWLLAHPDAEYRISEVREPLDRLFAGDLSLIWQNLLANLKFFTFTGDPWAHYNLLGRPVFADPVSAVLFYAGLFIALWRWRVPQYGFLLIWLFGALVPSITTAAPPSSVRDILGLVVVFAFPALALVETARWVKRRVPSARDKRKEHRFLAGATRVLYPASYILLLTPCLILTVRDYFVRWPVGEVVRFYYQTDLTAVAHRLDGLPVEASVAVAGLSVHSMDGPNLDLAARRDVDDIRLCDTRETLVVPGGLDAWLFVPRVVPFDTDLQERLLEWGAVVGTDSQPSFTSYHLTDDAILRHDLQCLENTITLYDGTPGTLPASFGGHLAFLGYEWLQQVPTPGDSLALLTYWRVEEPPPAPLKIFVHLTGESDAPIAQHDGLGSPPHGWQPGDLVVQKHVVPLPADLPPGHYDLQAGVYDTVTAVRLPVMATDRLRLHSFEVTE